MARIRYLDEMNQAGELDMSAVQAGDLVKFKADFIKRGDDDSDDTEKKVTEGEVGEILEVYADMPGLLVEAPCELTSMGSLISGEATVMVSPDDVVVLVDARDPRISSNRVMDLEASLEPAELDSHVRGLQLPNYLATNRQIVIASLTQNQLRKAARLVARQSDEDWASYVLEAEIAKTAATPRDWLPLIMWALEAMKADYPGEKSLSIKNPRHVRWALTALAKDIRGTLPKHEMDYEDEDTENALLADEMERLAEMTADMSTADWSEQLPGLADIMGDESLRQQYQVMVGELPKPEVTPEQMGQAIGVPQAPPAPAEPSLVELEEKMRLEDERARKWQEYLDRQKPAETPAAPEPLPSTESPTEMIPAESPAEPVPEAAPPPLEMPSGMGGSKYDVPAFGAEESPPHEWARAPRPQGAPVRIPIGVAPGYKGKGYQQTRSVRVWAEPEMPVRNKATKEEGDIVGFEAPNTILVNVIDPKTQLPKSEEPERWDEVQTQLAEDYPADELSDAELSAWREQRKLQKSEEWHKRKKDGMTVVSSAAVHGYSARQANRGATDGAPSRPSHFVQESGLSDTQGRRRGDQDVTGQQRGRREPNHPRRAARPDLDRGDRRPADSTVTVISAVDLARELT